MAGTVRALFGLPKSCIVNVRRVTPITQTRTIVSKIMRDPGYKRPKPFPYKEKEYNQWNSFFDDTTHRLDENSKLLVVDGPPTGNKGAFAKELADQLDMHYIHTPNLDNWYSYAYGDHDYSSVEHKIPEGMKKTTIADFLKNPQNMPATSRMQMMLLRQRHGHYMDAVSHLLNTGQGVVMLRSVYSDPVFMRTLFKAGYVRKEVKEYYDLAWDQGCYEFKRPHVVIYLDIPVDKILKNLEERKESRPYEVNSPFYTRKNLTLLENEYKKTYLKEIENGAEVLVYDWTEEIEAEEVVDDICRLDLSVHEGMRNKYKDWDFVDEWDWKMTRIAFSQHREKMECWLNVPNTKAPEVMINGYDYQDFIELCDDVPGFKYEEGWCPELGDKVMWK